MDNFESIQQARAEADSHFIDVRGFRIHYKRAGTGKTLVLLIHGSFLSLKSWRRVIEPLAADATVVAFDRPVFGLSSRPLAPGREASLYSADAQSDLVGELIEKLGFEKAVLVGSSTGGTIALLTALRRPERAQALVLVDAMVFSGYATSELPKPMLIMMKALRPAFTRLMGFMIAKLYDKAMRKFWHRQERFSDAELATYKSDFMIGPWRQAFFQLFLATRHLHLEERLNSLRLPALVISGEHDRAVKLPESERLARELPGAELHVIPDAGHLPQEETPEAFIAAMQPFLQRVIHPN